MFNRSAENLNSKISLSVDEVKNVWISGEYRLDGTL